MDKKPVIKVVGVGGGGGAVINTMILKGVEGVKFIAANTDACDLKISRSEKKIQMGVLLTKGLGGGSHPATGRDAALESYQEILEALRGADLVVVVAGLGGATGTGASPVIARAARELGSLVVGVVSVPHSREGKIRRRKADAGVHDLARYSDTLLIVANDALPKHTGSILDVFKPSDEILSHAVRCLTELSTGKPEVYAEIKEILSAGSIAAIYVGEASGADRFIDATKAALYSPLLDNNDVSCAKGALITVHASTDIAPAEIEAVRCYIGEVSGCDSFIVGVSDRLLRETVRVTAIFSGFDRPNQNAVEPPKEPARSIWEFAYDTEDPDDCA